MPLTPKQALFVAEYLVDLNATRAAIRAGYSERTARSVGAENLTKPDIMAAIEKAQSKRSERTEITADQVLQRYWALANADPNELTQVRRLCCRFCFGMNFAYQWRNQAEYDQAVALALTSALAATDKEGNHPEPLLPSCDGGFGYDPKIDPNEDCPKCDGEGIADVYLGDTRKLTDSGKLLFAGIKTTANGPEIKMHDRMAALDAVARHLGMFKTQVQLTGAKAIDDVLSALDDDS